MLKPCFSMIGGLSLLWLLSGMQCWGQTVSPAVSVTETTPADARSEGKWVALFNGRDLSGWIPKFRYSPLGENFGETFRVEDGLLKVVYDEQAYPSFGQRFGHLFYQQPFAHYRLRVEYRFVGQQCPGGPNWAFRNNGLMLHCEDPHGMDVDQDFPASIECQLLGGDGRRQRSTANLCTPGTNVVLNGQLFLPHCTNSTSQTYHGDQWVTLEVEVRGSEVIRHIIDGVVVLEYTEPQLDARDAHSRLLIARQNGVFHLTQGYIALQAESHPTQFRKIEIQVIDP